MIAPEAGLSVTRQCALLGIARSSFYYRPRPESEQELDLLKRLDRIFTNDPVYGSRRLQVGLLREGISVGRRRVRRLMKKLGLWAVRPKRNTSKRHLEHKVYPYLLRGKTIKQPNQVWAADVTYIPMQHGFLYLVAIIDWATPTGALLAAVKHAGGGVLCRGAVRGPRPVRPARHLQYRSGRAIHQQ
jgi:putative transposase